MKNRFQLQISALLRAIAHCMHPSVMLCALMPLFFLITVVGIFGTLLGKLVVQFVNNTLRNNFLGAYMLRLLEKINLAAYSDWVFDGIALLLIVPLLIIACFLLVTWCITPFIVRFVAQRRFTHLEKKHGGTMLASAVWSVKYFAIALGLFLLSLPFWLIPPLAVVLPLLIAGWLTGKVITFDVLADHASRQERQLLLKRYRLDLLLMGIATTLLGSVPSLLLAAGWFLSAILLPIAYSFIFVFSALWFCHFCLQALENLRVQQNAYQGSHSSS